VRAQGLRARSERGSAIADFTLVSVVLVPLFFAIFQLALIWHVKTTLTSAASEGARYGASYNRTPEAGQARTEQAVDAAFGGDFAAAVTAHTTRVDEQEVVEVVVRARVPVLAFWGPTVTVEATGHAIKEVLP
jgi:Flp pilus assembly protein TadG